MKRALVFIILAIGLSICPLASADAPQSMCVQAYLEDLSCNAVDGQVNFEVCIFEVPTGGTQLWPIPPAPCQPMPNVDVVSGLFSL